MCCKFYLCPSYVSVFTIVLGIFGICYSAFTPLNIRNISFQTSYCQWTHSCHGEWCNTDFLPNCHDLVVSTSSTQPCCSDITSGSKQQDSYRGTQICFKENSTLTIVNFTYYDNDTFHGSSECGSSDIETRIKSLNSSWTHKELSLLFEALGKSVPLEFYVFTICMYPIGLWFFYTMFILFAMDGSYHNSR